MSATTPCIPSCCSTTQTVNTPGPTGASAIASTTASFVIPAIGATVVVAVTDSSWMSLGQNLTVGDANFELTGINSGTSITIKYLGYTNDAAAGSTVLSGSNVLPGTAANILPITQGGTGAITALAAITALIKNQMSGVAAITDNTTGAASSTLAAGVGVNTVSIPIQLAAMTTAAADLVTNYTPGYAFKILAVSFAVTTLGTGAGATQVLNLEIGSTNLTGGVLTLTLANTTPLGNRVDATAITAANTGTDTDTISLEVAAGGTVFTAGAGVLLIKIQNMDTANAAASMASKINSLRTALTA